MKVVILDDSADLGDVMCQLLTFEGGAQCIATRSYEEFVQRAQDALTADLVVLDVNLGPDVPSGVDAYEWLRRHGYTGRVVFLTGHAGSHPLVQRARSLRGVPVLEKPVEAEQLLALL